MNINILKKCLDELAKEKPSLDYLKGMLETLSELEAQPMLKPAPLAESFKVMKTVQKDIQDSSEADILDAKARAAIERVKELAPQEMV